MYTSASRLWWVAGVASLMAASATIFGLFKDTRTVVLAFLGMVLAVAILLVVSTAAKEVDDKPSRFHDDLLKALAAFAVFYIVLVVLALTL